MPNNDANALRARLSANGLSSNDLDWLTRIAWSDSNVPAISGDAEHADYARREAALNAVAQNLSFAERAVSTEGKLAAAIGARIADWNDRAEEDEN